MASSDEVVMRGGEVTGHRWRDLQPQLLPALALPVVDLEVDGRACRTTLILHSVAQENQIIVVAPRLRPTNVCWHERLDDVVRSERPTVRPLVEEEETDVGCIQRGQARAAE